MTGSATDEVPHEREAKVSVWPGFRVPDLQANVPWMVAAEPEEQVLDARFLDARPAAAALGITFRHRTGEGSPDGRWTLKVPVPSEGIALDRLEIEVDGPPGQPPDHLASAVRGVLRGAELAEVAHLRTNRTVVAIRDPADRPLGLLTDDVVSAFDGDEVGWRFGRSRSRPRRARRPTSSTRSSTCCGRPARVSRTTCPSWPARSDPALAPGDPDVPPVDKHATTRAAFQGAIAASVRRLLLHDPVIRLDAGEEGVHQARVATRRLRSDLRTFRTLLDEEALAPLIEELRWLGGLLGEVRDADVLLQRLGEAVDGLEDADREAGRLLLDRVEADRKPHLAALHEALDSRRYLDLTQALVDLAVTPPSSRSRTARPVRPTRSWPAVRGST